MTPIQRAAMVLAHALAAQARAERDTSTHDRTAYYRRKTDIARVKFHAALKLAGRRYYEIGIQNELPWRLEDEGY